ncbi:methyl-accepting chemotaxis protein [Desulfoscipio geothermicus]|uniref:Methyl-accepting chemotaxis protein n=1 Tax=Desulfoscipio geothermicus DSM 3669 TaxID=1121426 RepID=A0A1I6CRG9_9FIRM|nr:methyl-accepting chemotaxis protein [Desulfoscipio geothermicus]SFQ95748.1 methyl-accepting chemotaxis protein [Desulfoscipio geothermicus DSM 3669]
MKMSVVTRSAIIVFVMLLFFFSVGGYMVHQFNNFGSGAARYSRQVLQDLDRAGIEPVLRQNLEQQLGDYNSQIARVKTNIYIMIGVAMVLAVIAVSGAAAMITGRMRKIGEVSGDISAGDLTKRIDMDTDDALGKTARGLNELVRNLQEMVRCLKDDAQQLAEYSEQLSGVSEEVSAAITEVATHSDQLAVAVEKQANNSATAVEASKKARTAAEEGYAVVRGTVDDMKVIESTVQETMAVFQKLNANSRQVEQILETITGIADQTNLLALNAAIEAARAGEQGRGFAVVAEEVRKLAEQSSVAAGDITVIVRQVDEDTARASEAMQKVVRLVGEGVGKSGLAGDRLEDIVREIAITAQMIQDMSASIEQTRNSTVSMAAASQQTSAAIEEVTGSAQQLAKMAGEFKELTARYTV